MNCLNLYKKLKNVEEDFLLFLYDNITDFYAKLTEDLKEKTNFIWEYLGADEKFEPESFMDLVNKKCGVDIELRNMAFVRLFDTISSERAEYILSDSSPFAGKYVDFTNKTKDVLWFDVPFDLKLTTLPASCYKYKNKILSGKLTESEKQNIIENLYGNRYCESRTHQSNNLYIIMVSEGCSREANYRMKADLKNTDLAIKSYANTKKIPTFINVGTDTNPVYSDVIFVLPIL